MEQLQSEIQITFWNLDEELAERMNKHSELLEKVKRGETPFRSIPHLYNLLLSDLDIKYLPE